MIAPSMAGDLWSAGGIKSLLFGAAIFGVLIGLLECWRRSLNTAGSLVLVVLFGIRVGGAMERDFVTGAATIIQLMVIFLLALAVLPVRNAERTPDHVSAPARRFPEESGTPEPVANET